MRWAGVAVGSGRGGAGSCCGVGGRDGDLDGISCLVVELGSENEAIGRFKLRKLVVGDETGLVGVLVVVCFDFFGGAAAIKGDETIVAAFAVLPFRLAAALLGI